LILPTQHILTAALRVIGLVDKDGETSATLRAAYSSDPNDGAYRSEELKHGQAVLQRCGLAEVHNGTVTVLSPARSIALLPEGEALRVLAERLLRAEQPPWLSIAVGREVMWEYIPDAVCRRLDDIVASLEERERLLLAAAQKVDGDLIRKVGQEGEEYIVALCKSELEERGRPELAPRVVHVSELSDHLGYDVVSPDLTGSPLHIEVKTQTGLRSRVRVFLSRNEAEQGKRDPRWILVVCERDARGTIGLLGWCTYAVLRALLPRDPEDGNCGRWVTAELTMRRESFRPGLPLG